MKNGVKIYMIFWIYTLSLKCILKKILKLKIVYKLINLKNI